MYTYKVNTITQLSQELSNRYFGNPAASLTDTTFSIGLPTALSIQTDYHYYKNLYFGGLLMLPLKIAKHQLRRPALLAFIPRYESSNFEVSMPVSFYDFYEMRFGFSVRYAFLTIGTDKLGTFVGLSNFDGFDLYFMMKFNFGKGRCANKFIKVCNQ